VTDTRFFEKRPLAIAAMDMELPSFTNGEQNFESVSTLYRGLTPVRDFLPAPACSHRETDCMDVKSNQ